MKKHPLVKNILITREEIQIRTKEVANEISQYYQTQSIEQNTVLAIGLLKGCVPFFAEFIANFSHECETDFMVVSSYNGNTKTSGEPKIVLDVNTKLKGRDILIIEDVIDSGYTLEYIKKYFLNRGAKTVKIVTLINKPLKRMVEISPDWTCFELGDSFLIGFGLDYEERLRNLPYVAECDIEKLKDWTW